MNPIFAFFLSFVTILLGFVQFFAVLELFSYIGLTNLINAPLSVFLVLVLPMVAAIIGFFGTWYAWQWNWMYSALLLTSSLLFYIFLERLGLGFSYTISLIKKGFSRAVRPLKKKP